MSHQFGYFYSNARERFLRAAKAKDAELQHIQNPNRGPDWEKLYVDVATLGPKNASKALLLMSGTHGVEGLCGSDVQTRTLETYSANDLPPDTKMVLIHAINPFGFAWLRRTTEEGVDLCRNFVDFEKPLPKNTVFGELIDSIVPEQWDGDVRQNADATLLNFIVEVGAKEFGDQIAVGQYEYWYAPFYGGNAQAWANRTFIQIVTEHFEDCTNVCALDYHTGLGENGTGEILCFHAAGTPALQRARKWWGAKLSAIFDSDETVAYPLTGGILEGLEQALCGKQLTAGAFEFGTADPVSVLTAMRADHWLHTHGSFKESSVSEIKAAMLAAFYDDTDQWRNRVWEQANAAQRIALAELQKIETEAKS